MELLVVITVISVLAALLLPALGKALNSAREVTCINNLKQFGYCFTLYTDDSDYYPNHRWPQALNPYINGTLLGSTELPDDGSNAVLTQVKPRDLIHCPSVPRATSSGVPITLSYSMNGINFNANFWKMLCIAGQNDTGQNENWPLPRVKPTQVYKPSQFGLMTEMWKTNNPAQCAWTTTWWRLFVGNGFTCLFTHGTRSNVLMADSHVQSAFGAPTGYDANAELWYIADQNDSLFNYDFGLLRLGERTPSRYLK